MNEVVAKIGSAAVAGGTNVLSTDDIATIFKLPPDPVTVTTLVRILDPRVFPGAVNSTDWIIGSIPYLRLPDQLIYIALGFRAGADPNGYVEVAGYGCIHLLGYVLLKLRDVIGPDLVTELFILCLEAGSNPGYAAFKNFSVQPLANYEPQTINISIKEWLFRSGYELPVGYDPQEALFLLNKKSNLSISPDRIIRNHTDFKYPLTTDTLDLSVSYINLAQFKQHVTTGIIPKYIVTNKIILKLVECWKNQLVIPYALLIEMMTLAVTYGAALDVEQFSLIRTVQQGEVATQLEKLYATPYWRKTCRVVGATASKRLITQAAQLGITTPDSTKEYLCEQLKTVADGDYSKIIESAIKRQKTRLALEHSVITDYDVATTESGVCMISKGTLLNPYEYADTAIASYSDQGKVYCFVAPNFEDLVADKLNPYTNKPLPATFVAKISNQLEIIKKLKIRASDFKSIPETLTQLDQPDKITNETSLQTATTIEHIMELHGVKPDKLKAVSKDKWMSILDPTGSAGLELTKLATTHAYFTVCHVLKLLVKLNKLDFVVAALR